MGALRALLPIVAGLIALVALALAVHVDGAGPSPGGPEAPELVVEEGGEEALTPELPDPSVTLASTDAAVPSPLGSRDLCEPEPSTPPPRGRFVVRDDRVS